LHIREVSRQSYVRTLPQAAIRGFRNIIMEALMRAAEFSTSIGAVTAQNSLFIAGKTRGAREEIHRS
jgi:hypothetical protein